MASEKRAQTSALISRLLDEPHRFVFFQAVRLALREFGLELETPAGEGGLRFSVHNTSRFPPGSIFSFDWNEDNSPPRLDMGVNFIGLTGPVGVLPQPFQQMVLSRENRSREVLAAFQDLFNHRIVELFYLAWKRYEFPIGYENTKLHGRDAAHEVVNSMLLALVGYRPSQLRQRTTVNDETWMYLAGTLRQQPKNMEVLGDSLAEIFSVPVEIIPFRGQWLELNDDALSRLPDDEAPEGRYCRLDSDFTVGTRVWDISSTIEIQLGPMAVEQYVRFLPPGDLFQPVADLVRGYLGPEYDFQIQLLLEPEATPFLRLPTGRQPVDSSDGSLVSWLTFVGESGTSGPVKGASFYFGDVEPECVYC